MCSTAVHPGDLLLLEDPIHSTDVNREGLHSVEMYATAMM